MNRSDLQRLSNARIREAKLLFAAGEYSGAYYLAGYSVECALKACFAKGVRRYDFPDKGRSDKVFTHVLSELVVVAKLKSELDAERQANRRFEAYWAEVIKWSEASRYTAKNRDEAETLLEAISRRKDGVLPWIKRRW